MKAPLDDATVFVIDDEQFGCVAAMQRLLKSVGLRAEAFASAEGVSAQSNSPKWSKLSGVRCKTPRNERTRCAAQIDRGGYSDSSHFHHRPRRYPP